MSSVGLWRQARDSVAVVCGVGVPSLLAGRGLEVSEGRGGGWYKGGGGGHHVL